VVVLPAALEPLEPPSLARRMLEEGRQPAVVADELLRGRFGGRLSDRHGQEHVTRELYAQRIPIPGYFRSNPYAS
jgi:hypothetical protein